MVAFAAASSLSRVPPTGCRMQVKPHQRQGDSSSFRWCDSQRPIVGRRCRAACPRRPEAGSPIRSSRDKATDESAGGIAAIPSRSDSVRSDGSKTLSSGPSPQVNRPRVSHQMPSTSAAARRRPAATTSLSPVPPARQKTPACPPRSSGAVTGPKRSRACRPPANAGDRRNHTNYAIACSPWPSTSWTHPGGRRLDPIRSAATWPARATAVIRPTIRIEKEFRWTTAPSRDPETPRVSDDSRDDAHWG
jgi:hypothetical protein